MLIEFRGGPCDGERIRLEREPEDVHFLIASHYPNKPVYRCVICECCIKDMVLADEVIDFAFIGYESQVRRVDDANPVVNSAEPQDEVY